MMRLKLIRKWLKKNDGLALMEAGILYPSLLVMIFGVYDVGHAITVNHKMITASQIVADLVTRGPQVSNAEIDDAVEAARLAMQPYVQSATEFGVDIVSVEFDADDEPVELWRERRNMPEGEGTSRLVERTEGLGTEGEGAVAVSIVYDYVPTFGNMVISQFRMRETGFARGRRSSTVTRE